jgi:hypothetical protein
VRRSSTSAHEDDRSWKHRVALDDHRQPRAALIVTDAPGQPHLVDVAALHVARSGAHVLHQLGDRAHLGSIVAVGLQGRHLCRQRLAVWEARRGSDKREADRS